MPERMGSKTSELTSRVGRLGEFRETVEPIVMEPEGGSNP